MLIKKIHVYTDGESAYIEAEGKTIIDLSQCEPEKWPQQLEAFSASLKETFTQVWGKGINVVFYGSDGGYPSDARYIVQHLAGVGEGQKGMSNENHQLFTSEQIRQRLNEGGDSARWLAQAVVSYYRPSAPAPSFFAFSTKLDEEAQGLFSQLLMIRSKPDWSDDQLAALVRECEQYLTN